MNNIKTLAIIDDDDVFVYLTTRLIEQTHLVDSVKVFDNGQDALEFLQEHKGKLDSLPELILLDLSMPIMDGWQFLDAYKKLLPEVRKKITIYILSSSISPDEVAKAKTISEVTDYVIKPISKEKLIDLINKLK